jgi:hypothetical protein
MRDTNPPLWRAILSFWSTLVVTCLAFNLLKTRIPNYLLFSIAAVISLAIACLFYKNTKYRTWEQKLYRMLDEYDPVDTRSYQAVQEQAKEYALRWEDVLMWCQLEYEALKKSGQTPRKKIPPPGTAEFKRFVSKKLQ